jgi:L-2-hydroxycarboxylate dehydrogenase (NAD+)
VHQTNQLMRVAAHDLHSFVAQTILACGTSAESAQTVADVLVATDLRGVESHGVGSLARYVRGLHEGSITVRPQYHILAETPAILRLDADAGLGHPVGVWSMEKAIAKARALGVGVVSVRNSTHFGMAAYYPMLALRSNMIGITLTNSGTHVIPTFGKKPMLGTNPIAVAVPAGKERPYVLDMSTSVVPVGRVAKYDWLGEVIPEGWAIDENGQADTDAKHILNTLMHKQGGGLLPLGGEGEARSGYKGYGLALMVEILSAVLSGSLYSDLTEPHAADGRPLPAGTGHLFIAVDIAAFRPLSEFQASMDDLMTRIKNSPKADGQNRIYIHGEKEAEEEERRRRDGIPLRASVVSRLRELATPLGVAIPF